jgi:hypothetical protein
MSTKRKIEDYKDQKVAIHCSTQEEWDKIVDLFPSDRSVEKIYWQQEINNGKSDTININGYGWSPKKHFENTGYTIYPASDFLEEKPFKFNIGDEIKAFQQGIKNVNDIPKECYPSNEIIIPQVIKSSKKQFKKITIESPTELDLKLKTIKPKQIQTIKI